MNLETQPGIAGSGAGHPPRLPRSLLVAVAVWLACAIAFTASGIVASAPRLVPIVLFGSVALGALVARVRPSVGRAVSSVPIAWLVAPHVLRLPIGVAFLIEHANGRLPALFAVRGGWGDIAAGGLALALLVSLRDGPRPRATLAWNVLGLLDILMVVATAQYLVFIALRFA